MNIFSKQTVERFGKYMAGGTLYFWVGYGVFALCYSGFHWGWLPSKIIADVIGWSLNYFVQRYWAFGDQAHLSEMQHAGRYIFIEAIGFVLDYLIIGFLNALGVTPYIGFFISAGFFTIWSFLWYKYWVFPKKAPELTQNGTLRPKSFTLDLGLHYSALILFKWRSTIKP